MSFLFSKYGSWEALDGCEILLQVAGTICPHGKPRSVGKKMFLGCLSSGGALAIIKWNVSGTAGLSHAHCWILGIVFL